MNRLKEGDVVSFEMAFDENFTGAVKALAEGRDIKELFAVMLDATSNQTAEFRGFVRKEDGSLINVYDISDEDKLEVIDVEREARKFIISGKMELTLEEEVFDECLAGEE